MFFAIPHLGFAYFYSWYSHSPTKVPDPFWQECMCPPGEAEDYYSSRCHPTGSPCVEREQCSGFNATCDTTVQDDGALSFVCLCQDGTEVPPSGHCSTSGVTSCFEADDPCGPFATCVEDFVGDEFTIACQCGTFVCLIVFCRWGRYWRVVVCYCCSRPRRLSVKC